MPVSSHYILEKGSGMKREPPAILVKTWVNLLLSSENKEVKDRAKSMLISSFGDMKAVTEFVERNQIQIGKG